MNKHLLQVLASLVDGKALDGDNKLDPETLYVLSTLYQKIQDMKVIEDINAKIKRGKFNQQAADACTQILDKIKAEIERLSDIAIILIKQDQKSFMAA